MLQEMPYYKKCFVCGRDNPHGLRQIIYYDSERESVLIKWAPAEHFVGYENIVHGGVFLTLLDEAMAWAAIRETKQPCLTVKMEVDFLDKAFYGNEYRIYGKVEEKKRRFLKTIGWVEDLSGKVYYKTKATYIMVKDEKFLEKFEGEL